MAATDYQNRARVNGPAVKGVAITPATPFTACRAVNCDSAGSATVTWFDGTTSTYYFELGNNPISIKNVAAGGSQGNLVALY